MVTHGHGIEADLVHHLDFDVTLICGVHQRALILVARIQNDYVLAGQLLAQFIDLGVNTRNAAKAFALGIAFGIAGAIVLADRLNTAVQIIDVNDV